ncbi:MAG: biopolymer transporter ExbD [Ignavibacteriae bacterium]|nr:biopolymer transporter ExbD [Ignavibacteriota bacterium]
MAGGGGDAPQPRSHSKKKRKKSKRLGIRIDMTPLVDVAFLLLTFFMLTTSMSRPQTMEINLPPEDVKVEIAESNLITLRVNEKGDVYWNLGIETPERIEFTKLRGFIREQAQQKPKLVTLVKIDPKAKYEVMVNIMDELNQADMQRFSVTRMTEKDQEIISKI